MKEVIEPCFYLFAPQVYLIEVLIAVSLLLGLFTRDSWGSSWAPHEHEYVENWRCPGGEYESARGGNQGEVCGVAYLYCAEVMRDFPLT